MINNLIEYEKDFKINDSATKHEIVSFLKLKPIMQEYLKSGYDDIWNFGRLAIISTDHHQPKLTDISVRWHGISVRDKLAKSCLSVGLCQAQGSGS